MVDSELDLNVPELALEDVLRIEDPYFTDGTVAIETGIVSGIGRTTAVALAANGLTVLDGAIDEHSWPRPPTSSRTVPLSQSTKSVVSPDSNAYWTRFAYV